MAFKQRSHKQKRNHSQSPERTSISANESSLTEERVKSLSLTQLQTQLDSSTDGLSQSEATARLSKYGNNELAKSTTSSLQQLLTHFWNPIAWMIEVAAILSALVRDWADFSIILTLLVVNAIIGFWEEDRAGNAIAALKAKLALKARVKRHFRLSCVAQSLLQRVTCLGQKSERFKFAQEKQTIGQCVYSLNCEALANLLLLSENLFAQGQSSHNILELLVPA